MKDRKGFIFYRSFYEAIQDLPLQNQLEVYEAIAKYSFTFKAPKLTGLSSTIFKLIKPQLDANNKKFLKGCEGAEHGAKGGRPKKPHQNPKANPKANPIKTPKVKEKVKEKDKGGNIYRSFNHLSIEHTEVDKLVGEGWTRTQIDSILDNIENYKKNTNYTSLVLTARNWLKRDYPISQDKKSWWNGLSDAEKATFI